MGLLANLAPVGRPGLPAAPLNPSKDAVGREAHDVEGAPAISTSSSANNPAPQRGRLIRDENGNVIGCSLPEDDAEQREAEQWPPKPLSEEEPVPRPVAAKTDLVRGEYATCNSIASTIPRCSWLSSGTGGPGLDVGYS